MPSLTTEPQVAVYIDFDNIVISRYNELHGPQSFRNDNAQRSNVSPFVRARLAEARLDFDAIVDFASSYGTVAISRAYANWALPVNTSYSTAMLKRSIDLVQLFPMSGSKNGADIRLAVDVIDDLSNYAALTHVVVVAGDSDYVSLAQRCKRLGRRVIGVGVNKSVGQYWESACDEFRYYGLLPGIADFATTAPPAATAERPGPTEDQFQDNPAALLVRALKLGYAKNDDAEWLAASGLKNQMKRIDSSFDETALGFRAFTPFLKSMTDVIDVKLGENGTLVRLKDTADRDAGVSRGAKAIQVSIDSTAVELRKFLSLPASSPLDEDTEHRCIDAIRTLWKLATPPRLSGAGTTPIIKDLAFALEEQGVAASLAARVAHQVLSTGLPLLVRDAEMYQHPNPEMVQLKDRDLLQLFRHWAVNRIRNSCYPKPFTPEMVCAAMYRPPAPPSAIADFNDAIMKAGHAQMCDELGPRLLPAAVLWDVAAAIVQVPADAMLTSAEVFATALIPPLRALERELDPNHAAAAHMSMQEAGLIGSSPTDSNNGAAGLADDEVVAAILKAWADRLRAADLLDTKDLLQREAFYRIALQDKFQIDWRAWVLEQIKHTS